jgi:glutaredoxin
MTMPRRALLLAALLCALLAPAQAQYKVVGPNGNVTYTDRPPSDANSKVTPLRAQGGSESEVARLPLALREPVTRYPVTLYTSNDLCAPCDSARQLLRQRGIPFSDKLAQSNEDKRQLQALIGALEIPALTIGSQVLRGFAPDSWHSYLDAAGYPRNSVLPSSYQPPAATPITPPPPNSQANKSIEPQPTPLPEGSASPAAPPANPIRF